MIANATLSRVPEQLMAGAAQTKSLYFEPKQIADIANKIATCAALNKSDQTSILRSVNFKVDNGDAFVCATDGSRLAYGTFKASGIFDVFNVNIPAKDIIAAGRATSAKRGGFYLVVLGTSFAIHDHDYLQLASGEIVAGEYPRYMELFPLRGDMKTVEIMHAKSAMRFGSHTAIERLVESAEQIEKACYVAETKRDSAKHGVIVLNFEPSTDKSEITCDVTMKHDYFSYNRNLLINDRERLLDRFKVAFCAKYLAEALDHNACVTMFYTAPLKPVIFEYNGSTVRHMLMPIQC